jgi:hypothetical protein
MELLRNSESCITIQCLHGGEHCETDVSYNSLVSQLLQENILKNYIMYSNTVRVKQNCCHTVVSCSVEDTVHYNMILRFMAQFF